MEEEVKKQEEIRLRKEQEEKERRDAAAELKQKEELRKLRAGVFVSSFTADERELKVLDDAATRSARIEADYSLNE